MKVTNTSLGTEETQTVTLDANVEMGDLPYGYPRTDGSTNPLWRPTAVRARVKRWRTDGGEWSAWRAEYVTLVGRRVRKDGSLGADVSDRYHSVRGGTEIGQWLDAWVRNNPDLPRPVVVPAVQEPAPVELDG